MVNTEYCSVHPESDDYPRDFCRLWDDDDVANLSVMTAAVHEHDGLAGVELWFGAANSGSTEIGTGAVVSGVRTLVSPELCVDPSRIDVVSGNTETGPHDFGSEGSRTLYGAGKAASAAAIEVRKILTHHFARRLEAHPDDIVLNAGTIAVGGSPDTEVPLADIVAEISLEAGPVIGTGRFQAPPTAQDLACTTQLPLEVFNDPTFHCHVAEVVVDTELGHLDIRRYGAIHDTGTVIDRAGVVGQIQGGVVQGIGQALFAQLIVDHTGQVVNDSLVDYRIPTIADIPHALTIDTIEDFRSEVGPLGAKGIGEAQVILPGPTLASAIRNATGARLTDLPLTADTVLAHFKQRTS